ncbi:MAG: 2-aminoethylphosphonate--pyruvate transaminase [archaeon]|nr:2-aminoethylphosphonate--pyruvate transaminase [archaeon]
MATSTARGSGSGDKMLFTPGPLTTSLEVKQAMLHDYGSRDRKFMETVADIHAQLLAVAGVDADAYAVVLMQGSGTFGVEAVVSSVFPPSVYEQVETDDSEVEPRLLVLINGAYGERIAAMAQVHRLPSLCLRFDEDTPVDVEAAVRALQQHPSITHAAVVHCETSSGIMNPVEALGEALASRCGRPVCYIVDAMSSFGGVPLDIPRSRISYLITSSNKCIQGCPGFAVILAELQHLRQTAGWARTLSLDVYGQWKTFLDTKQFRFTPPTHAILAFHHALGELLQEGGVPGRAARYRENNLTVRDGLTALGFSAFLNPSVQGHIITSFRHLDHPSFDFQAIYAKLNERGCVIYPGKLTKANCFRIGNIGALGKPEMEYLVRSVAEVMSELGITN